MIDLLPFIVGPVSFFFGTVAGLAIYRLLWHVDTAALRTDVERQITYNDALQTQVVKLTNQVDDLQLRIRILEETNNELMQIARAKTK